MNKRYIVKLDEVERASLLEVIQKGNHSARKVRRAQTLLLADEGTSDEQITRALKTSLSTVERTRKRFVEEGFEAALSERSRPGVPKKLDGKQEAFIVATACSTPPKGRSRWTMQLIADRMVEAGLVESVSDETVRRTLKKTS